MTGMAYYRGGPMHGRVRSAEIAERYLVFQAGRPPWPRYRLTGDVMPVDGVEYPIAEYVERAD